MKTRLNPTAPSEREPILDALRGFAILGILLVNIEAMRGPEWLALMETSSLPAPRGAIEKVVHFALGWLASGKFLSCLAILFGVGAALIAARSLNAGESPRAVLARRYGWLAVFGLVHMLLLFPGDVLFVYGVTGLVFLAFVRLRVATLLAWSAGLLAAYAYAGFHAIGFFLDGDGSVDGVGASFETLRAQAVTAFIEGSYADILALYRSHAWWFQTGQLAALPWILALFLFGFAAGRAGIANDLRARTRVLYAGAWIGLGLGLTVNFGLGFGGPLAGFVTYESAPAWVAEWALVGQLTGQPVLAVGYLSGLTLLFLRRGAPPALAAVGRMALTAYVLESALALAVFAGLDYYDRLTRSASLLVVAGIWALLLVACPLWLRRFRLGPLEWLWRTLSYGRMQPMR